MLKPSLKSLFVSVAIALSLSGVQAQTSTIKVGATPTAVPFNFLNPKTNTLEGVMVDVAQALSQEMGVNAEVTGMPFATLIPSLQTKKIDMISSAFAKTPARAEVVDFSDIVLTYKEALLVPIKDTTPYRNYDDLNGKVVGVMMGTSYVEPLKEVKGFKELKMYDTMADLVRDIALGRLEAGFGDGPVVAYQVKASAADKVRLVDTYESLMPTEISIAVRKGDTESLEKVNAALEKIKQNGSLEAILKKWDVSQ
ncbi:amino acid ABC transporter substrate-binding protein [Lampropedia aestuarii]|uniref:Amino acid ABC transporter substrate-binding protein n=1 Tax=Lampropedia aestuarii TaxID=2562762 RepID=A0A4S5BS00_9BURK|nr:ABC transporter substrate-binding protein [Lampropedia aestuarii]MDH5858110.1 ABC transporter substrate-binding protein [Lampropedia aestuarii]THJ33745.1 amino acid ABC transporter substrate-binding protein [Lampropedia aestuarii]